MESHREPNTLFSLSYGFGESAMPVEYINRKGQKYYLYEGRTKTGKPKYFFAMKSDGTLVPTLPEGYEIYENPNAQVFLRKILPQSITAEEIATVKAGVKQYAKLNYFIVDVKKKAIVVYLGEQKEIDDLMELSSFIPVRDTSVLRDSLARSRNYFPMMQFVLEDAKTREFSVQRWCSRSSVDGWLFLDCSTDLKSLVQTYGRHLGKESFYDLLPY
jgi:hypothetical protein